MPETVKCLVWDLDDTVWDGTLLEGDKPRPRPGLECVLRTLDSRGILQAVASRGEHDEAEAYLRELGLLEYFVHLEVGWGAKSDAVRRIARRLNLGLDTFAFIDNDRSERDEVGGALPQVRCYPHTALTEVPALPEFQPAVMTEESGQRRAMYQAEQRRHADEQHLGEHRAEFLAQLGLEMTIRRATEADLMRAHELTVRTHQLNTTGRSYSIGELRRLCHCDDHEVLVARLTDRYGCYGTIGLAVTERAGRDEVLRLLLVSCRVVSRGVGGVLLREVARRSRHAGLRPCAEFTPTAVNRIMLVTLRFAGYTVDTARPDGSLLLAQDGPAGSSPAADHVRVIAEPRQVLANPEDGR